VRLKKSEAIALITPYAGALATYKAEQGRNWQAQLREDWMTDNRRQWGLLRALRNDTRFGGFSQVFDAFAAYEKAQEEEA
jgi:hypothetical protein